MPPAQLGEADPGDAEVARERGGWGRPDQFVELLAGVGGGGGLHSTEARDAAVTASSVHLL